MVDAELRYYIENQSFYEKHELDFRECRDPMDLLRTCASHPSAPHINVAAATPIILVSRPSFSAPPGYALHPSAQVALEQMDR